MSGVDNVSEENSGQDSVGVGRGSLSGQKLLDVVEEPSPRPLELVGLRVEVKAAAVEVDGGLEVVSVAVAACGDADGLDA